MSLIYFYSEKTNLMDDRVILDKPLEIQFSTKYYIDFSKDLKEPKLSIKKMITM